jgi:hypothetical protein
MTNEISKPKGSLTSSFNSDDSEDTYYILETLQKKIFSNDESMRKPASLSNLALLQNNLCKHIENLNPGKIADNLCELLDLDINSELLASTSILKILKYFINLYSKSLEPLLKSLSKMCRYIYLKWKNILILNSLNREKANKEDIINPKLQERVCRRVIAILNSNGFESTESESLAISIEKNIRKRDPSMKEQYIKCIRKMIKDIKALDKNSYIKSEENQTSPV